ncbi:energy-coupling factor transporter transmembrane component T family protein [Sediminispirochaeta bajacaliforniensis]|uniref:energy-coupling factor transporter transmembrane component T family protein n=1 Tax=Sediminispirochaeta bajacaliforniensis TaxID=148 RepID=UPI00036DD447|nr:energy-coupling factor transporter transmembrane component T [Sediminispirochaeta bajacaliforniensis]
MAEKSIFYERKATPVHKLNPITKLYGLLWLLLLSFICSSIYTTLVVLAVIIVFSALAHSFRQTFRLVAAIIIPIFLFLSVIHGFLNPKNETILYSFSVLGITAKLGKEGLMVTYKLVSKLCLILPSVFLFVKTTSQERLMPNLIKKGVSPSVSYLFLATLNVLPYMRSKMDTIKIAQESRGISMEGNLPTRIRAFLPLLMPLILSSLTDIQSRSVTLEVRSFGVSKTVSSLYDLAEKPVDKILQLCFIMSGALLFVLWLLFKIGVLR